MKGMKGMKAAAVDGQITSTGSYIRPGFSGSCEEVARRAARPRCCVTFLKILKL